MRSNPQRNIPNFLIIQTAFLGDIVLTTPLIRAVKKAFPDSRIDVLLTPQGAELLRGLEGVNERLAYDKRGREKGIGGFLSQVRRIRKRAYDICISPHRSARTSLLSFLSGAPVRIGFATASLSFLYTFRVPRPPSFHEIDRNLGLLIGLGMSPEGAARSPVLPLDERTEEEVAALLDGVGVKETDTLMGIGPGSVWGTKRWPPAGFAEVGDALEDECGARIVLLGGPEDSRAAEGVLKAAKGRILNLVGRTTLKQAMGIIKRCRMYIGNDSALLHIASVFQTPTVGIFGPTVPGQGFGPSNHRSIVVEKKGLPCRPCSAHGPMECPEGHFTCMAGITPDEVLQAARRVLQQHAVIQSA